MCRTSEKKERKEKWQVSHAICRANSIAVRRVVVAAGVLAVSHGR